MSPESLPGAGKKSRNSDSTGTKPWLKNRLHKCFPLFLNLSIFSKGIPMEQFAHSFPTLTFAA